MTKINRTVKFAVSFPGHRGADLKGKDGLFYQLAVVQSDLARTATRMIGIMFALRQGRIPWPERDEKKVPEQTLVYQLLSGKWQPDEDPTYSPKGRQVGSAVFLGVSNVVYTRLKTDYIKVLRGEAVLPTFRTDMSIPIARNGIAFEPNGSIRLKLWAGHKNNSVKVHPVKVRGGQRAVLNRILSGEYKYGDAKLVRNRKGKWMLSVSWSGEVQSVEDGDYIAGIDLGITDSMKIAYVKPDGTFERFRDTVQVEESARRAARQVMRARQERSHFNRDQYALREGKGRTRKLRSTQHLQDKHARVVDTAIRQACSATIRAVQKRGVRLIVLEDLTGIRDRQIDETEGKSNRKAATARRIWILRWQPAKTRQYLKEAAEKAGIKVVEVQPAYTSKTCAQCGVVWTRTESKTVQSRLGKKKVEVRAPHDGFGRSGPRFKCECGHEENADFNAAVNIARRGVEVAVNG